MHGEYNVKPTQFNHQISTEDLGTPALLITSFTCATIPLEKLLRASYLYTELES